ncbi:MAG: tRNA pseudouridine(55) synthase TruB [Chloroflexi bacterium]|nr:tRNA pseudouridine(55) synthase TruB [Chloroflexota bacterium]
MHGILNLNKPEGPTSFQAVSQVRRCSGVRRVGHGGTLDPLARGVLPVLLGQATRLSEFMTQFSKVYRAEVMLGIATDTYDAAGRVTFQGDPSSLSSGQLEETLAAFRGSFFQLPPPFSAVKVRGRRLYSWARSGEAVELPVRQVQVFRLELVGWEPSCITLEVECGKGTYIRSLAQDLGERLGCGAHLHSLERTRVGPFRIEEALSLSQVEGAFEEGSWPDILRPMEEAVESLEKVVVEGEAERRARLGQALLLPPSVQPSKWRRAHSQDGRFLALLRFQPDTGLWHPEKVFLPWN